jgi:hypothetical protein
LITYAECSNGAEDRGFMKDEVEVDIPVLRYTISGEG